MNHPAPKTPLLPEPETVELPEGRRRIHENYGLWIFGCHRRSVWPPKTKIRPRRFSFYGLSHLLEGGGWYWTPASGRVKVKAGQAILSTPETVQDYGSDSTRYVEDAICFHGPLADHLLRSGILRDGVQEVGPARRLLPVFALAENPSDSAQIRANLLLHQLLVELYFENQPGGGKPVNTRLGVLLDNIRRQPEKWWALAEMAEFCGLSENQFRRVFQKETGLTPKLYVDRLKITLAGEMLCNSSRTVSELAEGFGYADSYHFSRRFKEITGLAPEHYRNTFALAR